MENQGRERKKEGEVKTAEVRRKRQKNEDADRKKGRGLLKILKKQRILFFNKPLVASTCVKLKKKGEQGWRKIFVRLIM